MSTAGSGAALGLGLLCSWSGVAADLAPTTSERLAQGCYALAVGLGGVSLYPRGWRSLKQLRLDIDVLMGLAILGAIGLGQWDEAATVAFLFGLAESLESLSLDRARGAIRDSLRSRRDSAERIAPDGTRSEGARQ